MDELPEYFDEPETEPESGSRNPPRPIKVKVPPLNSTLFEKHYQYWHDYRSKWAPNSTFSLFLEYYDMCSYCLIHNKASIGYNFHELMSVVNAAQSVILNAPRLHSTLKLYCEVESDFIEDAAKVVSKNFIKATSYSLSPNEKNVVIELEIPPNFPLFYLEVILEDGSETYLLPYGISLEIIEKSGKYYRVKPSLNIDLK